MTFVRVNGAIVNVGKITLAKFTVGSKKRPEDTPHEKLSLYFDGAPPQEVEGDQAIELMAYLCNLAEKQIGPDLSLYLRRDRGTH